MYTLSLALLAVFCLYIGIFAFFRWDADFLLSLDTVPVRVLFILVFVVFLAAALCLICRAAKKMSDKCLRRSALACIALIAVGQLVFLAVIQPQLRYDPLKIFDMAIEMLETHTISGTYEDGYFARYTNNYPLTILTYWLFLLLTKLGIAQSHFMRVVQVINVIFVTASVWISYLIARELRGGRTAVSFLMVCAVCPLSYVWAGYYYTATISMPFLMGVIYLWILIKKDFKSGTSSLKKCVLLFALMGFLLIFGCKIRATAAIAFIAVVIDALMILCRRLKDRGKNLLSVFKSYAVPMVSFLLAAALTLGVFSAAVDSYVDFDYENTGFPAVHWVMMGARWDGEYDVNDENYTYSFETKEEKVAADLEVLKERIVEAGPLGLISLAGRKLLTTWVDGTDDFQAENSYPATYSKIYDYLIGDKSAFVTIYSQAFRALSMLTCAGLSAYLLITRWKDRRTLRRTAHGSTQAEGSRQTKVPQRTAPSTPDPLFIVLLTFLGGMAFHLVWEANTLYSLSFSYLGLIILADGIYRFADSRIYERFSEKSLIITAPSLALLLVLLVISEKQLVETPIEDYDYSVDQYQYAGGFDGIITSYDQNYVQTFTASKPFNRISILGINDVGGYNQSAFCVKLTDENGEVLYDGGFATGLLVSLRDFEIELDEIVPDGPTVYTLEIYPGYIQDEDSLELLSYTTGNWDIYSGGSLSVGGEERENGDLVFSVYEYSVTTYFSLKQYVVICAGVLILCGGVTVLSRRKIQKRD